MSKHGDKGVINLLAESESRSTAVTDESDLTNKRKTWLRYKMPGDEVDNGRNNASKRYPGYGEGIVLRPSTHPHPPPSSSSSYSDHRKDRSLPYYVVPARKQDPVTGGLSTFSARPQGPAPALAGRARIV